MRIPLEEAFAFAFENIKPGDAVIVGMYPKFSGKIRDDAELSSRFAFIERTNQAA